MIRTRRPLLRRRLSGSPLVHLPGVVLLLALAGCSSTDTAAVPVPSPPPQEAKLCQALHKQLPQTLSGLDRRDTDPESELTADWGDAAIVLRCGVPRPANMSDPNALAVEADGVNWMVEQRDSGPRFTTTYRETYVQVTMSTKFSHDTTPLADLAAPVKKTVPSSL